MASPNRQPRLWRPTLSEALREAIRSSDMSVYRLAKEAGVAPAVISRFLKGERDLRLATVEKIAEVLNLELVQRRPLEGSEAVRPEVLREPVAREVEPPEVAGEVLLAQRRRQA